MKSITTFITPLFSLFTKNHIFLKEYFFVVILTHKFICSIISSKNLIKFLIFSIYISPILVIWQRAYINFLFKYPHFSKIILDHFSI